MPKEFDEAARIASQEPYYQMPSILILLVQVPQAPGCEKGGVILDELELACNQTLREQVVGLNAWVCRIRTVESQNPISSKSKTLIFSSMSLYPRETTADYIAANCSQAIKGKTVLITGVSPGGLGAEFAKVICKHAPGLLILANRDTAKASTTAQAIADLAPSVPTRILKLDLSPQAQVREAAREIMEDYPEVNIDVLINNAGVMASPHKLNVDGIEN
ncbi:hypothetical protein UA08_03688 [Talaromyces atroroseus]|uniref:Ketoreductase (KR) domain-containing protein n=1 Tax=Talaromyces atroroseus TaxID=1441469 RepID=A0A225AKL5_TALAT|nr:hypothetical protein UA08_03688 [Talaromyces atroroseus]OKL61420.1 hypothetical protein UA08_03688 [Talaromyces atroroseus]